MRQHEREGGAVPGGVRSPCGRPTPCADLCHRPARSHRRLPDIPQSPAPCGRSAATLWLQRLAENDPSNAMSYEEMPATLRGHCTYAHVSGVRSAGESVYESSWLGSSWRESAQRRLRTSFHEAVVRADKRCQRRGGSASGVELACSDHLATPTYSMERPAVAVRRLRHLVDPRNRGRRPAAAWSSKRRVALRQSGRALSAW